MSTQDLIQPMLKALYLLALAAFLLFINMRTYSSIVAKKLSYFGMWAAIFASAVVAVRAFV